MKFTIQNIIDCLHRNHFRFSCDLRSKDALFSEISVYSDGEYQDDILYICNLPQSGQEKSSVYIVSKAGDVIAVKNAELYDVHNTLLNLFDYLNHLEIRLIQAVLDKSKLEVFGSIVDEFFQGPSFFWYKDGYPRPLVSYYDENCHPVWKKLVTDPAEPHITLAALNGGTPLFPEADEPTICTLSDGHKLLYCPILWEDCVMSAMVILEQNMTFYPGDIYYLDCFAHIFKQQMLLHRDIYFLSNYLGQYVRSMISDTSMLLAREGAIRQTDAWSLTDELMLLATAPVVPYDPVETGTLELLQKQPLPKTCFIMDNRQNIIVLASKTYYPSDAVLCEYLNDSFRVPIRIGICTPFYGLRETPERYKAACTALAHCDADNPVIHEEEIISVELRRKLAHTTDLLPYIHPTLRILHAYDKRDDTKLVETLRCFVFNECNFTEVSKVLHISRNTLIKQIGIIQNLTGFDYQDYDQYRAVLYSFILYADIYPY